MLINTKGLVIKEQNLKDRDKLITIFTEEEGIIRAFVRNVKSLNNKNYSSTGLMCYSSFIIYRGKNEYIVNEANIIENFFNLRKDIIKLSLVQYFCELTMLLFQYNNDCNCMLKLLLNSIHMLSKTNKDINTIKTIFEMRAMCISGFTPNLLCCQNCNKYESENMFFIVEQSELYCKECYHESNHKSIVLNKGALTALRHIIYSDFNKIFNFNIKGQSAKMANIASEAFVLSIVGTTIKTLNFYKNIL